MATDAAENYIGRLRLVLNVFTLESSSFITPLSSVHFTRYVKETLHIVTVAELIMVGVANARRPQLHSINLYGGATTIGAEDAHR